MKKIKDRVTLGVIAGFIANIAKEATSFSFEKLGLINVTSPDKAAGIFISRRRAKSQLGTLIGIVADFCIACKLGILLVYYISATGKDNHLLKGMSIGSLAWSVMYGVLSRMGSTGFWVVRPKDSLAGFVTHSIFGLLAAQVVVSLGHESLFKPHYNTLSNPTSEEDGQELAY